MICYMYVFCAHFSFAIVNVTYLIRVFRPSFPLQVKSRTSAPGRAVNGGLRGATSWPATTASTQVPSRSSAATAIAASRGPITWRCTWSATCEARFKQGYPEEPENPEAGGRRRNPAETVCHQGTMKNLRNANQNHFIRGA